MGIWEFLTSCQSFLPKGGSFYVLSPKKEKIKKGQTLPLEECLAKTYSLPTGSIVGGRKVLDHCLIVGEVAKEILSRFPKKISKTLFPEGSELVAAAHDVGWGG